MNYKKFCHQSLIRILIMFFFSEEEFLDKFEYGDQVMADRGFEISDLLAVGGCTLNIPPFTRGKTQLSQREVEKGQQIATLRIPVHVKRAV